MRRAWFDFRRVILSRILAPGGSSPAEDRFVHTQRGPRDAGAKKWRGTSPSRRRQHASRAGVPDKRVVSPRLSKSECRAAQGGADGAAQVRLRALLRV